ncbi:nucleoside hydrolase [Amycolatopsis sp. CA-230715]|uniref:nucleoside hydrolase n=1 Tax=Amycolatopsis sp. CA-230715 TaxID=2745196 RepID=UPI001C01BEB5|nr:nucleoside hydrolase [Amycolatopsis sp. CA-230715]QWF78971.1 Non-specific ribonucleoside hydrolase RihC [Amycolatopsis sp. CA-230715]
MPDHHPAPIVVDTDGGLDDALAIVLLARSPGVELVGISSVHGNVTSGEAAANSARLLEVLGDHTTPVAVGASAPLAQPLHLSHPNDLLRRALGRPRRRTPAPSPAAEQIVALAKEHAGALDLLTLGPLTNIANALRLAPDLPRLLRRVVVMGGSFDGGNITEHAEANVHHDPEAAEEVFAAGFALTVVPLDVTRNAIATRSWLRALVSAAPRLKMKAAAALGLLAARGKKGPRLRMHDALAAAVLLDRRVATDHHSAPVLVALDGDRRGETTAGTGDRRPATIVRAADVDEFRARLLEALSG